MYNQLGKPKKKKNSFLSGPATKAFTPLPLGLVAIEFFSVLKKPDFEKKKFSTIFGLKEPYLKKKSFFLNGTPLTTPPPS